jgi:hypothetical protein
MKLSNKTLNLLLYGYPILYTGGLVASFWNMNKIADKCDSNHAK